MPTVCTICRHPQRAVIERSLLRQIPLRAIARDTKTSIAALHRHKAHVPAKLAKAELATQVCEASTLLKKITEVIEDAQRITAKAEKAKNFAAALTGLRTVTSSLELLGKVTGELRAENGVHLHQHAHLHASPTEPQALSDDALEIEIARDVAAATGNFNPDEIERLKRLLASLPSLPVSRESGLLLEA